MHWEYLNFEESQEPRRVARQPSASLVHFKGDAIPISETVMLVLSNRFGAIAPEIENPIAQLSAEQLQNLVVVVFNFTSSQDLVVWLGNLS